MTIPAGDVEGLVTRDSPHSFPRTLERLEGAIREKGLEVFARFDHSGAARRSGLSMPDTQVLVFGNPRAGTPVMLASPLIAIDLPLRVLVWTNSNERVRVSYLGAAYLMERYRLPADLAKNIAGIEAIVGAALRDEQPHV